MIDEFWNFSMELGRLFDQQRYPEPSWLHMIAYRSNEV